MKIRAYTNHFGMIMSSVIAIIVSLVMSSSAIIVDHLTFTVPLLIKNWGTAFMVITFTGMIFPLNEWSFAISGKLGFKPGSLQQGLVTNTVSTIFFNTAATFVLAAVNLFDNAEIAGAIAAGYLPYESVTDMYIQTCIHDWPIMFVISFVVAFFVTMFAEKIAVACVAAAHENKQH